MEAIAAVDGIDVLWIGQRDLTTSLGIPGQFDRPEYLAAVDRVIGAAGAHGKAAAIMITSAEEGLAQLARGFRCLAFGDVWVYEQALRSGIDVLRTAVRGREEGRREEE